mmetsp:Transcript_11361/g.15884  ORF Transcript_11361/g.15884 Transcript_11361/m.15884 type:complete len:99 (+) Transcript_11361:1085-1381(+)
MRLRKFAQRRRLRVTARRTLQGSLVLLAVKEFYMSAPHDSMKTQMIYATIFFFKLFFLLNSRLVHVFVPAVTSVKFSSGISRSSRSECYQRMFGHNSS